jgi:hypothetical protein
MPCSNGRRNKVPRCHAIYDVFLTSTVVLGNVRKAPEYV